MPEIDFNSDLGEGFSIYRAGDDAAILPHLTSECMLLLCPGVRQPGIRKLARKENRTELLHTVLRQWHMLPREAVDALSLKVLRARLDGALGSLI